MRRFVPLAALGVLAASACAQNKVSLDQVAQPEVVLQSVPRGCTVTVDNVDRGTTPLVFRAGSREATHSLLFTHEGYLAAPMTITGEEVRAHSGQEIVVMLPPATWDANAPFQSQNAGHLTRAGKDLAKANRCQEALPYFERAIELDPRFASAHKALGACCARLKRPTQALEHYKAYLRYAPPDAPDLASVRALVSQAQGDIEFSPAKKSEE